MNIPLSDEEIKVSQKYECTRQCHLALCSIFVLGVRYKLIQTNF